MTEKMTMKLWLDTKNIIKAELKGKVSPRGELPREAKRGFTKGSPGLRGKRVFLAEVMGQAF